MKKFKIALLFCCSVMLANAQNSTTAKASTTGNIPVSGNSSAKSATGSSYKSTNPGSASSKPNQTAKKEPRRVHVAAKMPPKLESK